jgi:hypothetical protein
MSLFIAKRLGFSFTKDYVKQLSLSEKHNLLLSFAKQHNDRIELVNNPYYYGFGCSDDHIKYSYNSFYLTEKISSSCLTEIHLHKFDCDYIFKLCVAVDKLNARTYNKSSNVYEICTLKSGSKYWKCKKKTTVIKKAKNKISKLPRFVRLSDGINFFTYNLHGVAKFSNSPWSLQKLSSFFIANLFPLHISILLHEMLPSLIFNVLIKEGYPCSSIVDLSRFHMYPFFAGHPLYH